MAIKQRGKKKTQSLYKRVPKKYEAVESRKLIWLSLHTDSRTEAESKSGPAWEQLVAGWEATLDKVALPVAGHDPRLNLLRAVADP